MEKKKLPIIITVIALILILGSCGSKGNNNKDDSSSDINVLESSSESKVITEQETATTTMTTTTTTTTLAVKSTTKEIATIVSTTGSNISPENTIEETHTTEVETPEIETVVESEIQIETASDDISTKFEITSLEHGELLDYTTVAGPLVIKAKIQPSLTNKLTIDQNYMNVADVILNQGGNQFDEIQYWAVADMTDGSESKVISFTLDKATIDGIYNGNIVDIQLGDYANDLWILPSLKN